MVNELGSCISVDTLNRKRSPCVYTSQNLLILSRIQEVQTNRQTGRQADFSIKENPDSTARVSQKTGEYGLLSLIVYKKVPEQ